MTDLLGTPSMDTISRVRNDKARRYLTSMRKKQPVSFAQKFPNADPLALKLLERLLAFDPKDRPTAEEALADPYFKGLAKAEREPSCKSISKMEFEFERRRVTKEDLRELIFREILEYHPQLRKDYMNGVERTNFLHPSAVDQFRKQFSHLEENGGNGVPVVPMDRKHVSLPRSTVVHSNPIPSKEQPIAANMRDRQNGEESCSRNCRDSEGVASSLTRTIQVQPRNALAKPGKVVGPGLAYDSGNKEKYDPRPQVRNAVGPSQIMPSAYCYDRSGVMKQERPVETHREMNSHAKPMAPCGMAAKLGPDIAINIDSNPFYMMRAGVTKPDRVDDRITIDTNLLQAKSQYGGIGATTAAAHRKVGTVQYGMSRMY